MCNIKIRNSVLLNYGTVQCKWSAQTIWPGPTAAIMMACVDRPRMLLQNIHNHVCTSLYGALIQTTLQILITVSTSNPSPNIIKNWNVDGNVTLRKLNYKRAVYIVTQYLISHTFSTKCVHCYILHLKNRSKQTIFNINSHFTITTTYVEFHTLLNYTARKLNCWLWNKTAYMAMER
jgi:hypothetical protein